MEKETETLTKERMDIIRQIDRRIDILTYQQYAQDWFSRLSLRRENSRRMMEGQRMANPIGEIEER